MIEQILEVLGINDTAGFLLGQESEPPGQQPYEKKRLVEEGLIIEERTVQHPKASSVLVTVQTVFVPPRPQKLVLVGTKSDVAFMIDEDGSGEEYEYNPTDEKTADVINNLLTAVVEFLESENE